MTDPNNIKEIDGVVPAESCTALAFSSGALWIGDKHGNITIAGISSKSGSPKFAVRCFLGTTKKNYLIRNLVSIEKPQLMLVHYTTLAFMPGPVDVIHSGGMRSTVFQDASFVLSSFTKSGDSTVYVAIISENIINVYRFLDEIMVLCFTFFANGKITAADMCDDSIVYFAEKQYYMLNLKTQKASELAKSVVKKPFVKTMSEDSFLVAYQEYMNLVSLSLDAPQVINYHPEYKIPEMIYGKMDGLYQIFPKLFTRIDLGAPDSHLIFEIKNLNSPIKLCCMINQDLLVVNQECWYLVSSVPPPDEMFNAIVSGQTERIYKILGSLPADLCSDNMIDLFAKLWETNKCVEALDLASQFVWLSDPKQLLCLFPQIRNIAFPEFKGRRYRVPKGNTVDIIPTSSYNMQIFEKLQVVVEKMLQVFTRRNLSIRSIRVIATSLACIYVIRQETRKLNDIIKNQEEVDFTQIQKFVEEGINNKLPFGPSYAVLKTIKGELASAMNIWESLYNAAQNDFFLLEASFTLRECTDEKSDAELFVKYINWLYERNPGTAINALLSTKHDPEVVLSFLSEKQRKRETILYLDYTMHQPGFVPRADMLLDCFKSYIAILSTIDSQDFNFESIEFTNSARNLKMTGEELRKAAKIELTQKTIALLEHHAEYIDPQTYIDQLTENIDSMIFYGIYRISGRYHDAIQKMMEGKEEIPYEMIEQFCRTAPDPQKAFNEAFLLIGSDKLFLKKNDFIARNLIYIDPIETLKMIPETQRVKEISNIVKVLFNLLVQRNESLDKQIAITEALKGDANYRLARARSKYCTIDSTTLCDGCKTPLGNIPFLLAPDGKMYHTHCKPNK